MKFYESLPLTGYLLLGSTWAAMDTKSMGIKMNFLQLLSNVKFINIHTIRNVNRTFGIVLPQRVDIIVADTNNAPGCPLK